MAGSDLSSSGGSPPARAPQARSATRKRGDGDDDSTGPLPSGATRSSAAARKAVVGPVRVARRAAKGALWAERKWRGRGLGDVEVERMREVILGVRQVLSVHVPDDIAKSLYPKTSFPKIPVGIGDQHQASVPEWKNAPSEEETVDYRAETLTKMGTIVCPLNMDISATDGKRETRKELVNNCNCSHPGSEDCVRVHVTKARVWIKDQLGEEAFKNCGLDAMGEQVGELWTAVEKKKLEDVCKLICQNDHQSFMEITKDLSPKQTKDLPIYYYNVFHPRRLASLTRAEHKKEEAVDRDDQKSSQSDENNERRARKKGRSSGSSSTRCRSAGSRHAGRN